MKHFLLGFLVLTLLFSCKNEPKSIEKVVDTVKEVAKQANSYKLTPFTPSPSFPGATIQNMSYVNGAFGFDVAGGGYELGQQTDDAPQKMCANSGKGQHIHLIVDNSPYSAQYTSNFNYDISDGEHIILAFISRSYHESIKSAGAAIVEKVKVQNKSISSREDVDGPMLFYSRPKGTYTGDDTKKVMLDFYVKDATLGSEYSVKADINGEIHMLDNWQPYYIEGLPMGDNTITLTLLDKNGNAADVPLNPVSRTFKMVADPPKN